MTTLVKITLAFLLALFLSSCGFDINLGAGISGNGNITEEAREISEDFSVVSASEGIAVYITQADSFTITVEADENVINLIGTDIKDGELRIHAIKNIGRATKKVYVSLPEISGLEASSGADLTIQNSISSDRIKLNGSSGAMLKVDITANDIKVDVSSGANIKLSGDAELLHVSASSGGAIKATDLSVKTCYADASSGADININVSESLTAEASSGGNVSYTGDANVQKKNSVSGSISKN